MTANSEARKRTENAETFGVFFDRSDYRDFQPPGRGVHEYRTFPGARSHYWTYDTDPWIAVEVRGGRPVKFMGPLADLRGVIDALELAYDRIANPPARTNPYTSAGPLRRDS